MDFGEDASLDMRNTGGGEGRTNNHCLLDRASQSSSKEHVRVVNDRSAVLESLIPRCIEDPSSGHVALIRDITPHLDEALKAESQYLGCHDPEDVLERMACLAAEHVQKWSVRNDDDETETVLSVAQNTSGDFKALDPKKMESMYVLRHLKTRRNRTKVTPFRWRDSCFSCIWSMFVAK